DHHLRPGNSLIGMRGLDALVGIPGRRNDTRRDREDAEEAEQKLPLRLDSALHEKLRYAAKAIAAIPSLAEDDTERQREAFEEASQELKRALAPLANLHTAYLMDGNIRPGEYARLLSYFAEEKRKEDLCPELREVSERVRQYRKRHHFFHWPLE